jgi:L-ascorbate metabolism protein UlaG (beta-lactamase superfamily)
MTEIEYLGHSAFALRHGEEEVLIDPYLSQGPTAPPSAVGDAVELSKRFGCPVLATFEVAAKLEELGAQTISGNIGGEFVFPFGRVKMFQAVHSSSYGDLHSLGMASSFLVTLGDWNLFHAGDTALFGDLALIGEEADIDLAMLPVGGVFTLDVRDAARAMGLLKAKRMVPMHYNTWKEIEVSDEEMRSACQGRGFELVVLRPGQSIRP